MTKYEQSNGAESDILHEAKRLRLLAAALELQYFTSAAAYMVPIPGTERFIVIGTPAEVRGLLPAAPAVNSLTTNAVAGQNGAEVASNDAARDVLAERRRQVESEGMTNEDDDRYHAAELPRAAASYILNGANGEAPYIWPWAKSWWKPRDARANYVRAAALLLAEIERIDRAQEGGAA